MRRHVAGEGGEPGSLQEEPFPAVGGVGTEPRDRGDIGQSPKHLTVGGVAHRLQQGSPEDLLRIGSGQIGLEAVGPRPEASQGGGLDGSGEFLAREFLQGSQTGGFGRGWKVASQGREHQAEDRRAVTASSEEVILTPDDVQDDAVVRGVCVVPMAVPIGGSDMKLDIAVEQGAVRAGQDGILVVRAAGIGGDTAKEKMEAESLEGSGRVRLALPDGGDLPFVHAQVHHTRPTYNVLLMSIESVVESLRAQIREIPDYPEPGILFYDITTLLKRPGLFQRTVDMMAEPFIGQDVDVVVAMESRGFIFGAPLAYLLGAGFAPIRKLGKLPGETIQREYTLEYATNTLEIHTDAIAPGQRVLLVDDLLATGGTVAASVDIVLELGGVPVGVAVLVELPALGGRDRLARYGVPIVSFIQY